MAQEKEKEKEKEKAVDRRFTVEEAQELEKAAYDRGFKAAEQQALQVQKAQADVIDEAIRRSVKRWEINPNSRYLLVFDGRRIQADIIEEFAHSLVRHKVTNVLLHVAADIEAAVMFKEMTK